VSIISFIVEGEHTLSVALVPFTPASPKEMV
jgi:hypothetical protein